MTSIGFGQYEYWPGIAFKLKQRLLSIQFPDVHHVAPCSWRSDRTLTSVVWHIEIGGLSRWKQSSWRGGGEDFCWGSVTEDTAWSVVEFGGHEVEVSLVVGDLAAFGEVLPEHTLSCQGKKSLSLCSAGSPRPAVRRGHPACSCRRLASRCTISHRSS